MERGGTTKAKSSRLSSLPTISNRVVNATRDGCPPDSATATALPPGKPTATSRPTISARRPGPRRLEGAPAVAENNESIARYPTPNGADNVSRPRISTPPLNHASRLPTRTLRQSSAIPSPLPSQALGSRASEAGWGRGAGETEGRPSPGPGFPNTLKEELARFT